MTVSLQGVVFRGCQLGEKRPIILIIRRCHNLNLESHEEENQAETISRISYLCLLENLSL